MRLTLRTLLAYLDDVLKPTDTKEIGAKIAESNQASVLINRIRDVMRRRRLTAPDVAGPNSGLDPNIVSEYIDNTLPDDNVGQVEQICLDSDIHLAEVAACHQIVVLCESLKVNQEGIKVPPKTREHLYALGPGGKKVAVAVAPAAQPVPVPRSGFSDEVPDYLKSSGGKGSAWLYGLAAVLGLVWVGIVLSDSSLFRSGQEKNGQPVELAQNGEPANPPEVVADNGKQLEQKPAPAQAGPEKKPQPNVPIDPMPPEDDGQKTPMTDTMPPVPITLPMNPVNPNEKPQEPVASIPSTNPPLPNPNNQNPPLPNPSNQNPPLPNPNGNPPLPRPGELPVAPARELPPMEYGVENEGILLISEESRPGWFVVSKRTIFRGGEQLAVPEPFEAWLTIGGGRSKVYLGTQTAVTLLKSTATPENCEFGLDLRQGQVVLVGDASAPADKPIVPVAIRLHGENLRLELLTPDTRCGLEVIPRHPEAVNQVLTDNSYTGTLRVLTGAVKLADSTGKLWQINAREQFPLTPELREKLAALDGAVPNETLVDIPAWLDPQVSAISSSRRSFGRKYEREFTTNSVTESIRPLLDDSNPQIVEVATRTLALTEDYDALVKCLLESTYGEARSAAIQGLRDWLPRSAQHGQQLAQSLTQRLNAEDAGEVARLLWGYSDQDAKNQAASEQLVDLLEDPKSYVRQLAILQIFKLTGTDYGFQPDQSEVIRARKVADIKARVTRQGGLLKP